MTKPARRPARKPRRGARAPEALIEALGAPPADPRALATWSARLMAQVTWLELRGEIGRTLAARIRANVGAITRTLPRLFNATDDYDGELDDGEPEGAELEDLETDGAIRVG